ncbi:response regulator [Deinococcus cellulosilyticus]|uniref:Response regulator n=1 Tax=Deinococcus cellulosilyticus (strain DSM 18568 / NBRC 106333 / KACC 11606 / 5516J-15) TaxID=1223518 RepID=A0A511MWC1_DEIC1|nr:response regulator [Deinococcus cellulosilyticus]GEM44558.1 response regulator [Deinococcus cellulosilyticus NBRC 106333 = KACC 11606]
MQGRQIVAVEDSDQDHDVFCWALKRSGRKNPVVRIATGDRVIPFLQEKATEHWPFVMVLDLNLPGMGGLEILRTMKADPVLRTIPVIVLTTSEHPTDVDTCYNLGVNSYLKKSLDTLNFVKDVQVMMDYWLDRVVLPEQVQPWTA